MCTPLEVEKSLLDFANILVCGYRLAVVMHVKGMMQQKFYTNYAAPKQRQVRQSHQLCLHSLHFWCGIQLTLTLQGDPSGQ